MSMDVRGQSGYSLDVIEKSAAILLKDILSVGLLTPDQLFFKDVYLMFTLLVELVAGLTLWMKTVCLVFMVYRAGAWLGSSWAFKFSD